MITETQHRGPDRNGIYCDERISIGHNLLAITDTPERSAQPVVSQDRNAVLAYNGEIYNYVELRENLKKRGFTFLTDSDTEVLFAGLEADGDRFLQELNGMFAIAYYRKNDSKLFLARDPNGIKPIYYYLKNGQLIFSSEKRGIFVHEISRKLDWDSFNIFLDMGYVPGPRTLIENVYKVRPGECVIFDIGKKEINKKWFMLEEKEFLLNKFDAPKLRGVIQGAVISHTMGRRPVGLYLSGGLDSSIILHELHSVKKCDIQTFTTRFEGDHPQFNEDADIAEKMCYKYGIKHESLVITEREFLNTVEDVIATIEEPRHNNSLAAYYLLSKHASKHVVVTLSGDGGDELFGGYPKYYQSKKISSLYQRFPTHLVNLYFTCQDKISRRTDLLDWLKLNDPITRWIYFNRFTLPSEHLFFKFKRKTKYLLDYMHSIKPPFLNTNPLDFENTLMDLDRYFWLADECFLRSDKIGMRFGMEARFPFLDRNLVDLTRRIASNNKLDSIQFRPKALLRQAYENILPDYILNKRKSGWRAPVGKWITSELGERINEVISSGFYNETSQIFNFEAIKHASRREPAILGSRKIFSIFSFQIWARYFKIKI